MTKNEEIVLRALQHDNLSSTDIAQATQLSQPTVSRTLKGMHVIKLGGGRSTVFALIDSRPPLSLYQVSSEGMISLIGELYFQSGGRMVLNLKKGYVEYEGLPFYFYDALPAGFLGSITLKNIIVRDPMLTTNSQQWSTVQILHYLTHYGKDLTGNLILSQPMAIKAGELQYPITTRADYSQITSDINKAPENLGSSVAGKQPKFTAYNGSEHIIVKYSPLMAEDNPVATRHRDLLICEHLALSSLTQSGVKASETYLHQDDRIYLEIKRFDRIGAHGREGIVSLRTIDAEYVGKNSNWPDIAISLLTQGLISQEDYFNVEVAYTFGRYIANSDMHNGNFSFFIKDLTLKGTTPIYDMLPMAFMPVQGELRNPDIVLPRFIGTSEEAQVKAKDIAIQFWMSVMEHPLISNEFKTQTQTLYESLVKGTQSLK